MAKICNWDEYVCSLRAMLPRMTAYENKWYGRWLPDFWAMLTSLIAEQTIGNLYSNTRGLNAP